MMLSKQEFQKWYFRISGNPVLTGYENHVITLGILITLFGSVIGLIFNLSLDLDPVLIWTTVAGSIFYAILYVLNRIGKKYNLTKWLLFISIFIYMDFLWMKNMGSNGPIIYIYIVYYSALLFVWSGKTRMIYVGAFIVNTLLMFWFEYTYPDFFKDYENENIRLIDIYSGLLLYLIIASFLMLSLKRMYVQQKEKAEQNDRLKTAFLANMSHEIRTPMNAILGFSGLLKTKDIPKEKKDRYIDIIVSNGNYLIKIIDDIIDFAKIEAGENELRLDEIQMNLFFEEIHLTITRFAKEQKSFDLDISYKIDPPDLVIENDLLRLRQVMINLLTNAVKYTPSGYIRYSCVQKGQHYLFSVSDSGIGINRKHLQFIFDKFHKVESKAVNFYPGTGLGLSIVKRLIGLMKGEIWVESTENKGSTFYFKIPSSGNNTLTPQN